MSELPKSAPRFAENHTNSRRQLTDAWKHERAFRVGMTLSRLGALLSVFAIILNYKYIAGYTPWGDLLLLFGCLVSLILSDPKRTSRHFVWSPMYVGYSVAIAITIYRTGGLSSPFLGSYLALHFIGGLVIQARYRATTVLAWTATYLVTFFLLDSQIPAAAKASLPSLYIVSMVGIVFFAIAICIHGFLKTEKDLAEEFEDRYRELFEAKASLSREEAANAAKTNFLANISHELRTPLGAILGYVELLQENQLEPEKREYFDIVKRNGHQLSRLVDDLLDLSKVEAGRLEVERIEFHPATIFAEVLDLFELVAEKKHLELKLAYTNPIPARLIGDSIRLKQILVNIVGNAVKFTEAGSVSINAQYLHAGTETGPTQLVVSVSDTGRGLAKEEQHKLFQPFSQADASMSRKYGGTGLGLNLSQKLARLLGGDLQLTYSEPGRGSVFTFNVKAERAPGSPMLTTYEQSLEAKAPGLAAVPKANAALSGIHILVVDDTADNRSLLTKFLEGAGANVECACDGTEGIQKALSAKYDVVLMDIQMPGLDGLQATTLLRQKSYKGPILALTAHAMKQDKERCLDAGCNDHLTKPVRREQLIRSIESWTSNKTTRSSDSTTQQPSVSL
jgi:signal transduction histidine kinase/CheY-like chemotaxis protein